MLNKVFKIFDTSEWSTEARLLRWLILIWLCVGLAALFSASYAFADVAQRDGLYYFKQQLIWAAIGLLIFHGVASFDLRYTMKLATTGLVVTLFLLFATHIPGIGETRNASTRWLSAGNVLIQPSELIKPFLVLQAAQLFACWDQTSWRRRLGWLVVFSLALLGILAQPNLSMTALCGITLWLIALAAGLPLLQLGGTALLGVAVAFISVISKDYQQRRIMSFMNPWLDRQGDGFQLSQSLMAIGSGDMWGVGFGMSQQKLFLPFQYTDFIFAIYAEEFGIVGGVCLILLLLVFATVGLRVAVKCTNSVVRLVAIGTTILLVGQSFLNIGVATGVLPTTGLPFPFMTYGGSSMLSNLFVAGLLVRSAREMSTAQVILFPKLAAPIQPKRKRRNLSAVK
jgi:cell division protein FtsW